MKPYHLYTALSITVFTFALSSVHAFPIDSMELMDQEALSESVDVEVPPTSRTPCPFINMLIKQGKIGEDTVGVQELIEAAECYGIDKELMRTLANGRAEKERPIILLNKLLDPTLFPAHRGSLARNDQDLSTIDPERTAKLFEFSTDRRISWSQLRDYQIYCWSLSNMSLFKDKLPAKAELHLLWDLFGAYREKGEDGIETIPVQMVYDFLHDSTLPEDFEANKVNPSTRSGLIFKLLCGLFSK